MSFMDINFRAAVPSFDALREKLRDRRRLHRMIAGTMADKVEQNFEEEGRPKWQDLAPSTIEQRGRKGRWPGKILQRDGQLAASISARSTQDSATVGSNLIYAAIHQFGGQAGPGRRVTIPARPYLQLTPDDISEIVDEVNEAIMDL